MLTEQELDRRIEDLCDHFASYVTLTNNTYRFDSPARHFHIRAIGRLASAKSVDEVLNDELFYDYLYATLVSWGMTGRGAKLVGFTEFSDSIKNSRHDIVELSGYSLGQLAEMGDADSKVYFNELVRLICQIFPKVSISATESKLVANSKALHHILPNLIPPVDRNYTLRFFYDNKRVKRGDACISQFLDVLSYFEQIYIVVGEEVEELVQTHSFNSSVTKVIDNAIIGYCRRNLLGPKGSQ